MFPSRKMLLWKTFTNIDQCKCGAKSEHAECTFCFSFYYLGSVSSMISGIQDIIQKSFYNIFKEKNIFHYATKCNNLCWQARHDFHTSSHICLIPIMSKDQNVPPEKH